MKTAGIIVYDILIWGSIFLAIFCDPIFWFAAGGNAACFGIFMIKYVERKKESPRIDYRDDEEIMDYTRALLALNEEFPGASREIS